MNEDEIAALLREIQLELRLLRVAVERLSGRTPTSLAPRGGRMEAAAPEPRTAVGVPDPPGTGRITVDTGRVTVDYRQMTSGAP